MRHSCVTSRSFCAACEIAPSVLNTRLAELDIDARYIGALPNPAVPAYVGINARIGWHMTDHLELALSGYNLAGVHREFSAIVFEPNALLTLKWTR